MEEAWMDAPETRASRDLYRFGRQSEGLVLYLFISSILPSNRSIRDKSIRNFKIDSAVVLATPTDQVSGCILPSVGSKLARYYGLIDHRMYRNSTLASVYWLIQYHRAFSWNYSKRTKATDRANI
ncbi:uncharacterized protein BO80DRAFT_49282 [Aspergillus ibericus CBS 121593]|uniref:Uncharacterized protein n=1 Tax=Aspergillus ibericus CBS 121593 TaxID=1448316 RepID=A0A395H298_9EURO|nr:hypothetical protein BO80DRAFT_49282 [Aspergillus ibericus CBS 121593]RAL02007.1 hypothetical protein BO80DRAFT_49282 [Aspergillus ibericus CBS 121593]